MKFTDAVGQPLETGDRVAQPTRHGKLTSYRIRTVTELSTEFSYRSGEYVSFVRLDGGVRKFSPTNVVKLYGTSPEQMDRIRQERDQS